ncbi:hypothetical protein GCM10023082_55920 [Streptomyces tremellae]|uniref:Uncharacterized protein n=1 Tax=Streptomyces tremellae TaxID=1124239 RepID=A0ABP7G1K6_9ACTN
MTRSVSSTGHLYSAGNPTGIEEADQCAAGLPDRHEDGWSVTSIRHLLMRTLRRTGFFICEHPHPIHRGLNRLDWNEWEYINLHPAQQPDYDVT